MFGSGRQSPASDGGSHGFEWVCLALSCFTLVAAVQGQDSETGGLIPYTRKEYEAEGLSRTHSHAELTRLAALTAYVCTRASKPEHIPDRVRTLAPEDALLWLGWAGCLEWSRALGTSGERGAIVPEELTDFLSEGILLSLRPLRLEPAYAVPLVEAATEYLEGFPGNKASELFLSCSMDVVCQGAVRLSPLPPQQRLGNAVRSLVWDERGTSEWLRCELAFRATIGSTEAEKGAVERARRQDRNPEIARLWFSARIHCRGEKPLLWSLDSSHQNSGRSVFRNAESS